ncbi:MAG: hypothetical protein GY928_07735 [Colwellia sp.]|nr:hypothetical protein [Colwellia sp.]
MRQFEEALTAVTPTKLKALLFLRQFEEHGTHGSHTHHTEGDFILGQFEEDTHCSDTHHTEGDFILKQFEEECLALMTYSWSCEDATQCTNPS